MSEVVDFAEDSGRTGTAVGVHLVRHGQAEPDDFVEVIARRRAADASAGKSPETPRQVEFVRSFLAAASE